jgi:hypothetical protein
LSRLLRVTVGAVQYLVAVTTAVQAATFLVLDRIYHYIVTLGRVTVTGFQDVGSDYIHPGLPPEVTITDA